ncbi:hypothetical protein GQ44DRAFT_109820 [Phaeosphaeriaceae sp. PMI808]|nr:hypothetical protein GQ44DRAFT_109820 [Phaeosphaeriaceae sp. PMI808]
MYTAIICACLISLKPFLRKHFPRLLGSSYAATTYEQTTRTKRRTIQRTVDRYQLPSQDGDEVPLAAIPTEPLGRTVKHDASMGTGGEGKGLQ